MSQSGRAFIVIVIFAVVAAGVSLLSAAISEGGVPGTVPIPDAVLIESAAS
jgi:hypothetical protein